MEWLIILFGAIIFVGFYQTLTLLGKLKQKSDESAHTLEDILGILEEIRNLLQDIETNTSSNSDSLEDD